MDNRQHAATGTSGRAGPVGGRASGVIMARLVREVLDALPDQVRGRATRTFGDPNRRDWHYIPRPRAGLPLREMGEEARERVDRLLRFALSEAGHEKAVGIMALEEPLGRIERNEAFRDPLNYSLTVFGTPGHGAWGWRIEGHHLSLNFTGADERIVGVTPAFLGSNPATVPAHLPMAGRRVLARESDLAFELIRGLDEAARQQAVIALTSPGNIVTGPGREAALERPVGLALGAMAEPGRNLALALMETYARNLRKDLAEAAFARLREAGLADVRFAWAGAFDGRGAHYWRLHGAVALIEFDNTQNDANHIHSVWHDRTLDFGGDPLRDHYEHGHHHAH
ncbi:MAG TPA: DUF3500 domain-containing protein [Geminicoccaceae bacterium]